MHKFVSITEKILIPLILAAVPLLAQADLQLTEIMPDPEGDDSAEWIELYNPDSLPISTEGYSLLVKTRTTNLPPHIIEPNNYLTLTKNEAGFTLTNTGAAVALIDAANNTISSLNYGKAPTGQSYSFINTSWQWTSQPTPGSQNIIAATKSASVKETTLVSSYNSVTLKDVPDLSSGDKIIIEGIVAAAPGEIADNIAFINGLQLNLMSLPPEILRGQKLKISGAISKTITYGTRLTVRSENDIKILDQVSEPEPVNLKIEGIKPNHEGTLITTTGRVVQRGANWFTLEDNSSQIQINLRNQSHAWPKINGQEEMTVTGLVTGSKGKLHLWPRQPNDIVFNQIFINPEQTETIDLKDNESTNSTTYIFTIIIVITLIAGWWWQKRKLPSLWQLLKNKIDKLKNKTQIK